VGVSGQPGPEQRCQWTAAQLWVPGCLALSSQVEFFCVFPFTLQPRFQWVLSIGPLVTPAAVAAKTSRVGKGV